MCLRLQRSDKIVKLASIVLSTRDIYIHTPVCIFLNNTYLVHVRSVRLITTDLVSTSTYVHLSDVNRRLSTCVVFYKANKEKIIRCYVDANFSGGWDQVDSDNAKQVMSRLGHIITYVVCFILWRSKL